MRKLAAVIILLIALSPSNALAATCFSIESSGTVFLEFEGSAGPYIHLIGKMIRSDGQEAPVLGSAHLRSSDGKARFAVWISGTSTRVPLIFEGTLNPPDFTSGSGVLAIQNVNSSFFIVNVSAVVCP